MQITKLGCLVGYWWKMHHFPNFHIHTVDVKFSPFTVTTYRGKMLYATKDRFNGWNPPIRLNQLCLGQRTKLVEKHLGLTLPLYLQLLKRWNIRPPLRANSWGRSSLKRVISVHNFEAIIALVSRFLFNCAFHVIHSLAKMFNRLYMYMDEENF